MKEKDAIVDFNDHQVVLYTEKEDDSLGPVQTGSYISKNYLDDYRLKHKNLDDSLLVKLQNNEISPIYYFMTMEDLTISELAGRVGIASFKVKSHLKPEGFLKMRVGTLKKYAEVFNVPLANMLQIITTRQDNKWRVHHDEKSTENFIEQIKTGNPLIVITQIERK
ncbi:MAG: hypothetical protein HXX09_07640 [Bacteroidetes bacterium]|nr:hypothetical protein [Bacteroidota bacterium]